VYGNIYPGVNVYIRISDGDGLECIRSVECQPAELEYGRKEIEENVVRNGDAEGGGLDIRSEMSRTAA